MPRALYEAIARAGGSKPAVKIFGQDVVDHYLNAAGSSRSCTTRSSTTGTASATSSEAERSASQTSGIVANPTAARAPGGILA